MDKVLLVLHLFIAIGLVVVVLLQRSEGGGLGMGGGSSGGFMTGRGTANLLTRTTAALATAFFITSIGLTLLARHGAKPASPLDLPSLPPLGSSAPGTAVPGAAPPPAGGGTTPLPSAAAPVPEKGKEQPAAPKQ